MNSKQRMKLALDHQEADRIPVGEIDICEAIASQVLGREAWVGYGGSHRGKRANEMALAGRMDEYNQRQLEDLVALTKKLELDFLLIWPVPKQVQKPQQLAENTWLFGYTEKDGWSIWRYLPDSDVYVEIDSWLKKGGIAALEREVERLEKIEPSLEGLDFQYIDWVRQEIGDDVYLIGDLDLYLGLYTAATELLLEAFALRPDLIERLLDVRVRHAIPYLQAQVDHGVDAVLGGEDWAGINGPLVSPRMFRSMVLPRMQQLVARCHEAGIPYIKHTDGNITRIEKELLVESRVDGYQAIEPGAGMDIFKLKKLYGQHLCLFGNVDCSRLLCQGTREEVAQQTRQIIDGCAPGGGFVLTSSNSIHGGVKYVNFMTMLETARKYGYYSTL